MTTVLKHSIRASAGMFGSLRPEGWHPKLSVTVAGPTAAGAELVWAVRSPGGSPWFEHRVAVAELAAEQTAAVELQRWEAGLDLAEPGEAPFTLRLVSELDGVDELLHEGALTAVALEGEQRYAVDNDWLFGLGLIGLDVVDEPDAPRLTVGFFLDGDPDPGLVEVHCFVDGRRIARANAVTSPRESTANDGSVVGREFIASFDDVRGWNNLSSSGWGGDWHLLDAHDGAYEVKVISSSAVCRAIAFDVAGGRIAAAGAVEADPFVGAVMLVDASAPMGAGPMGAGPTGSSAAAAFYGDGSTASNWLDREALYVARVGHPESVEGVEGGDGGEGGGGGESVPGPEVAEALQAWFDRSERLLATWEADLIGAPGSVDYDSVLQAEAVLRERAGYDELNQAAAAVPAGYCVQLAGETVTVGRLRERVAALFPAASVRITGAAQSHEDELAPYRAVLAGDKLAVFEEHPANAFLYTTTDRRVIETPDELAAAEYWYFEGPIDLASTASVDGLEVKVTTEGWRVLGWRFDAEGGIVEEFETQGPGSSAPKSAFQHGA